MNHLLGKTTFFTFDIDWAHDEVLSYAIDLVEEADVHATWFVTHETPLLKRLRENPKFELGIHPNFNNILAGKYDPDNGKSAEQVIDKLLSIVPEARSVRSHSMTQISQLLQLFVEKGLTHDCNHFIPHQTLHEFPNYSSRPLICWLLIQPTYWNNSQKIQPMP